MSIFRTLAACATAFLAGACSTTAQLQPAVLKDASAESMEAIKASLADAMGIAQISLGPIDPTVSSAISVLPPRPNSLEGRSTAMPVMFDLMMDRDACFLVRRETGAAYRLKGVECRPVK